MVRMGGGLESVSQGAGALGFISIFGTAGASYNSALSKQFAGAAEQGGCGTSKHNWS